MFEIKVGSKLKLGTAGSTQILTIDGMNVEAASLIKNAGEFVANDNVTIQNANAGTATGGVLYNTGKEATATLNGTVTGNGAKQGAVAYNDKGTVTIKKGTYTQNIATQNGGVIYSANGAIVNIEGGLFDSNEAKTATGGVAGGNATTTITGGIFQNNKAANGASVLNIASGYTADISNATITGNTLVREGTKTVYNGAIYISGSGQLTLEDCDIHDNTGLFSSVENPGCDVRLGASAVLNIKNNTSVGVVNKSEKTDGTTGGTINILGENIGTLILIPSKGNYTSSSQLVTFAETLNADKENIAAGIVVREYISQTECTDDKYCVDTEGKLQYKNPEAQIGTTTYLTLADAIAVAETKSIVYVLKDITVDETIAIGSDESPKELTITNIAGKDITITRTTELTANMFEIKVGSKLKLGTAGSTQTLTIDGADVEGKSLIGNAGTFVTNDNVTLQNANAGSTDAVDCYGGVLSNSGTATLDGTMTGNTASRGAVVYNTGTVTIKGGIYSNNTATMGGTVVYSHNKTTAIVNIEDGLFEGNVAQGATGGVASGNNKETTITGGTFCKNTALDGGAVMNVANGCTAIVSNATMTENTVKSGKNNYNGAIYISGGGNLTLKDCNVSGNFGVASSRANPACDVRVGDNATLNIKNNINLGVVSKISAKGTINIIEKYTGQMILFPHSAKYETGIVLVTFAEEMSGDEKANAVANIIVRKYTSNTAYTEDEYCVDTDGLLQYKNAEAKAGIKTYLTLADAIAAADTPSTVYVLKDIEVAGTIAIGSVEEPKELTITNIANKEVTITRTAAVNMFNVPAGSALNIDGTITLDGNKGTVTGASLITNAGTFVTSKDVTIQNASAGTETDKIGGVLTNTGTATLNGTMTGNEAYRGAIVYNTGKVTFESGTYSNNTAKQNAGVIYSNSSSAVVEIQGGLFEYNRSNTGTGGVAAGTATTTITGGTFQNNEAVTGAPVINVATDCTASISNATIKDNKVLEKSGKTDKYYNGAIYLSISATLNLSNCNISGTIGVYKSEKDPGSDIGLGAKSTLNVYDNISVGVVWRRDNKDGEGTINILTENPGTMMLIPFGGTYKEGNSLVTFSNTLSPDAKAKIASAIIVRQYTSKDVWDDTSYYVDTDGKLQKKPAAH